MAELLIGFLIGLVVGPVIRSWVAWREYVVASREARLHQEVLRLMSGSPGQRIPDSPPTRST